MTHDPMCLADPATTNERCHYCRLIVAVREDERSKNIGVVSLGALAKAQEHTYASGYVAALRDAVEAVKVSLSADIELVERSQVIADIEALGGER